MSSDPGWWARKLGNQPPPVPQASGQQAYKYVTPQTPVPAQQQYLPQQQAPQVTTENLFEMTQYWTGGEAHLKERQPCPNCGGQHYYSRNMGVTRGPPPAPLCYDCGFNGMFQQGDPGVWGATA